MTALPTLRLRSPVPFPASVVGAGGISVSKASGTWTIQPNFSALATIAASAVSDPSLKQLWIYDPNTGEYNVLTLAGLGDALYKLTSTTSLTIGTGSQVFTTQANKELSVGAWVVATSNAAATNYMAGQVTAYSGTSLTISVPTGGTGGSGTHADWTIRAAGSIGPAGAAPGIKQAYSSTTADADPGNGTFRLNNATPASATAAYLDNLDASGATVSTVLDLWDDSTSTVKGSVTFEKATDTTVWARFQITGSVVDGTGYRKLTLTNGSGSGAFTAADVFTITFARSGDKGSGVGDLLAANNLSDLSAKYTGKDNISIHGADIASASTINLETATGDLVDVTGTTTITAITLSEGHERVVRFTGILTLKGNGSNLVLPQGGNDITTGAGDFARFRGYAAGIVRCTNYQPATQSGLRTLGGLTATAIAAAGQLPATATNDTATAGNVGEYISGDTVLGSAVSLSSTTAANIASISLTAGDWDVCAVARFTGGGTTTVTSITADISAVSATIDLTDGRVVSSFLNGQAPFGAITLSLAIPPIRLSLAGTTTVYLVCSATFGTSTCTAYGIIGARRAR